MKIASAGLLVVGGLLSGCSKTAESETKENPVQALTSGNNS